MTSHRATLSDIPSREDKVRALQNLTGVEPTGKMTTETVEALQQNLAEPNENIEEVLKAMFALGDDDSNGADFAKILGDLRSVLTRSGYANSGSLSPSFAAGVLSSGGGGLRIGAGGYLGRNAQCASLTHALVPTLASTTEWTSGARVMSGGIQAGTPIATFMFQGSGTNGYGPPSSPTGIAGGSHTAIFMGYTQNGGMIVFDQWAGSGGAQFREIRAGSGINGADSYHVVASGGRSDHLASLNQIPPMPHQLQAMIVNPSQTMLASSKAPASAVLAPKHV